MQITLSPGTQKLLDEHLTRGGYTSPDDLVRAALQALDAQEPIALDDSTLEAIDRSEEQIERGEVHPLDDVRDRIRDRFAGR